MTGVLVREKRDTDTEKAEKMDAETGLTRTQTKGHLEPTEAGRDRNDPSLGSLDRKWHCPHLDFRFLASRTESIHLFPSFLPSFLSS